MQLIEDKTISFQSVETHNYREELLPHTCTPAVYTREVTQPGCDSFGYITYICTACGYSYKGDYTPPAHQYTRTAVVKPTCTEEGYTEYVCSRCGAAEKRDYVSPSHTPGEWETVREPGYDSAGEKALLCAVCGEKLEEEEIPKLKYVEAVRIQDSLQIYKGGSETLQAAIEPDDAANRKVNYVSDNPSIASVDPDGTVHALQMGTTRIICSSEDGMASAECIVEVRLTLLQWIVHILTGGYRRAP